MAPPSPPPPTKKPAINKPHKPRPEEAPPVLRPHQPSPAPPRHPTTTPSPKGMAAWPRWKRYTITGLFATVIISGAVWGAMLKMRVEAQSVCPPPCPAPAPNPHTALTDDDPRTGKQKDSRSHDRRKGPHPRAAARAPGQAEEGARRQARGSARADEGAGERAVGEGVRIMATGFDDSHLCREVSATMAAVGSARVELAGGRFSALARRVRVQGPQPSPILTMTGCAGYGEHLDARLSDESLDRALGIVAMLPMPTASMYDMSTVAWSC